MSVFASRIPRTVIALGVVSLLTDLSSEMIYPLLPIFLASVLGAGAVTLGLIEGVAESTAALNLSILKNYWLLGGLVLANVMQFLVIYSAPLNRIFHTVPIPLSDVCLIGAVASLVLWVEEIRKFSVRRVA